jgi:uncharacterized protein (DUF1697 family)
MTERRVALLRGVNVGKANRIAMADLRRAFERLGYTDVGTLLNSGNVAYSCAGGPVGGDVKAIEDAVARMGVKTGVVVMKGKDLAAAVRDNPLSKVADDPSRLLLMAFREPKLLSLVKPLLEERWSPEALVLGKHVAYLWCAHGILESKAWPAVNRAVGNAVTARNLTTMTKLASLAG